MRVPALSSCGSATTCVTTYTAARVLHTLVFLAETQQPSRTIPFLTGLAAALTLAGSTLQQA